MQEMVSRVRREILRTDFFAIFGGKDLLLGRFLGPALPEHKSRAFESHPNFHSKNLKELVVGSFAAKSHTPRIKRCFRGFPSRRCKTASFTLEMAHSAA